jgi:hypothetical protein
MFFICKLLFLLAFLIGSFWFSNHFYEGYAEFARFASAIFLILQLSILVTWAWDISDLILLHIESLEKNQQNESGHKCEIFCYQTLLVVGTLFLMIAAIVLWALMFYWFGGCMLNQVLIGATIAAVVILHILSLCVGHGSIFVTSIVALYGTYLCYSGLSQSDSSCNQFYNKKNTLSLWLGIVITIAAVLYAGCSVSSSSNTYKDSDNVNQSCNSGDKKVKCEKECADDNAENQCLGTSNNYGDLEEGKRASKVKEECNSGQTMSDNDKDEKKQNVIFHLSMAFASVYFAMLFTNWATDTAASSTANRRSNVSMAINIASEWVCFILYLWTLCAPRLFPNRSFN